MKRLLWTVAELEIRNCTKLAYGEATTDASVFSHFISKKYNFLLGEKKGRREVWGEKTGFFLLQGVTPQEREGGGIFQPVISSTQSLLSFSLHSSLEKKRENISFFCMQQNEKVSLNYRLMFVLIGRNFFIFVNRANDWRFFRFLRQLA